MFNSRQYEWSDLAIILGGRDLIGIRGVKYVEKAEKEAFYAKGRYPHSIQTGNISIEGEITVTQSELIALQKAGNGSILGLNLDGVFAYGNPSEGTPMETDTITGISFTEAPKELKQGDKFMECVLPFMAIKVKPTE
jgi:hypothetical protein